MKGGGEVTGELRESTWLRGAIHARPAGLMVRLMATYDAAVRIITCARVADAKSMLDLLALGADEGDHIELAADGHDAAAALRALKDLIERNFDQVLVPESGRALVNGIAIGRAVLVVPRALRSAPRANVEREILLAHAALARARADLAQLIDNLVPEERPFFAPEHELLDAIEPLFLAAITGGHAAHEAALEATAGIEHDLILDARARLLDALEGETPTENASSPEVTGEASILVVRGLTPTLVARLPPEVLGIVVLSEDAQAGSRAATTSHAVLLARGRGLPLAFVRQEVAESVVRGSWIIIDATTDQARVWLNPESGPIEEARARSERNASQRVTLSARAAAPLTNLSIKVRANVSSLADIVPEGADGVGLLRTELVFAGRARAPSLSEQVNAFARVASAARGGTLTIRLFDAGADKPLAWLPPPGADASLRGIELLFLHPEILRTQLRAIAAIAGRAQVRVLVPMTRTADDIERVRAMAKPGLQVGAMVESTSAAAGASLIADASDFVSIGTNDLSASLVSTARESGVTASPAVVYREVRRVVHAAQSVGKQVTVCGELAAEEGAALALVGLGVDAVSVSPSRFLNVKLALLDTTLEECGRRAEAALL